jgi:hypothetical protein
VVVSGRTPAKLYAFANEFGYATIDLSSIYDDPTIDLHLAHAERPVLA